MKGWRGEESETKRSGKRRKAHERKKKEKTRRK